MDLGSGKIGIKLLFLILHMVNMRKYVSVITKYPNKMEGFKPLMIEKLYEIINKNIKLQNQILLREKDKLARYENHLTSDLFKVIYRKKN